MVTTQWPRGHRQCCGDTSFIAVLLAISCLALMSPIAHAQSVPTNCRPNAGAPYECAVSQPKPYRYQADTCGAGAGGHQSEASAYAVFVSGFASACNVSFDPQNYPGAASGSYIVACSGGTPGSVPVYWHGRESQNWKIDRVTHSGFGAICGTPATYTRGAVKRSRGFNCPQGYQTFSQDVCYRKLAQRDYLKYIGPGCEREGQCRTNNPINVGAANKFTMESDYSGAGPGALSFSRYYNSLPFAGTATNLYRDTSFIAGGSGFGGYAGLFSEPSQQSSAFKALGLGAIGVGWRHTYQRTIMLETSAILTSAFVVRHDGRVLSFTKSAGLWYAPVDIAYELTETTDGGVQTGWRLTSADRTVETYDLSGRLLVLRGPTGAEQLLSYDSCGRLAAVTSEFGHSLTFGYDGTCEFFVPYRIASMTIDGAATYSYQYDDQGRLVSVTAPDQTTREYLYENGAFKIALTGIVDESGQRFATVTYDSEGRPTQSEHAGGADRATVTYTYAGLAVSKASLSLGGGTPITYDFVVKQGVPRVSAQSAYCQGCPVNAKTLTYDSNGNVTKRLSFNDFETRYTYDLTRNLELSRTEGLTTSGAADSSTRTVATQWHSTFRRPTEISTYAGATATGTPERTTAFTYDSNGNLLTRTVTDPATSSSRVWSWTYDGYGRMLTADGPRTDVADVTTYTYNTCAIGYACGQLATATDAAGHVTIYTSYNAHGQPLSISDPNGVVTTLSYDSRQRLTSRSVGGETTTFSYWPTGLLKRVTLADGSYLDYSYDAAHRLTGIADNEGNRIAYTLDAMGNRIQEDSFDPSNALARTRSWTINLLNQISAEIGAANTPAVTTGYAYDNNGNLRTTTAPLGRVTNQYYDRLERVASVAGPLPGTTDYGYDPQDNLTRVTDPRGLVTDYDYDGLGDLTALSSPDTGVTTYDHDAAGNMIVQTDARGQTATYGYDALNRVTSITYPDQIISYAYDMGIYGNGRLSSMTDGSGSSSWTYTAQGRTSTRGQLTAGLNRTVSYTYNTAGQLTALTYPSGVVVNFGYTAGKVTSIVSGAETILTGALYDPFGPVRGWTWGNSSVAVRTYDLDGNPTQLDSGGLKTYTLDDAFRITGITDASDPSRSWSYGYDLLDRLTAATRTGLTQGWSYDANGNRLSQTGSMPSTYSVASASNRLNGVSGAVWRTYGYDAAGNTTADGTATFGYNAAGRMVAATKGGVTATYAHNALGQRVRKTTGGVTTIFVYDEAGHLLGEYEDLGMPIREYVWLGDIPVAVITGGPGTPPYLYWYIHSDHLNTPRMVENPTTGQIVWRWDSAPFGETAPNEDPDGDMIPFTMPLRFPGQYLDAETGLHYNYFRDFEPRTGRYVESDPIGLHGGMSTYAYANGNPITFDDPMGLCPKVFYTNWREPIRVESNAPLHGQCELQQTKWRLSGSLAAQSGSCECQDVVMCTYHVMWEEISRARPRDCETRQPLADWGDWLDGFGKYWGQFTIPYNCKTQEFEPKGAIKL